ncbi:39S ribosomal protein L16, mitochondrial [Malassezia japonica]|uniref:39S ribosomal protein L16, mitochondrial n=1 Tax=Malassezia japonica TaxID=223818 RepID=A0AAF0F6S2_9BASI|nr:39S ribosomal protein L16, mitochondrial [Malassezia japonica]WFD40826.1 39S ribosomal protein L16, mitochondrial [Malassezia japonica]
MPVAGQQQRYASNLGPRRTKYRKAHKGRVSFPTGGSVKGTTISQGIYGIRTLEPCRLSATQLTAAETALKRKLKVVRGSQVFMRVFPDVPVCVKGNETRMGKGKGSFEFWACRVPVGRVLFEIGGHVEVRQEVAKEALRLAAAKLPIKTEFVTASTPPRLGREVDAALANNVAIPEDSQP